MSTMQRYTEQLIGDLKAAKKNVPPDPKLGTEKTYEEFAEKMFAIETAPPQAPKKLFGVSYEELPPPEKLSDTQKAQIINAVIDTWSEFGIFAEFPDEAPTDLRYKLVREHFADDFHYMPGFSCHIDFCSGWCPDCEILEYCDIWQENWTQEEINAERKKAKQ